MGILNIVESVRNLYAIVVLSHFTQEMNCKNYFVCWRQIQKSHDENYEKRH